MARNNDLRQLGRSPHRLLQRTGADRRKDNLASVRRPTRIALSLAVFREKGPRSTALGRSDVSFQPLRVMVAEQYLRAVGRPLGVQGVQGSIGQLNGVASIPVSPPQNAFREGNVRPELPVPCECDLVGGDASEVGLPPTGLRVIAIQFTAQDHSMGKNLCPVLAGNRGIPADWA